MILFPKGIQSIFGNLDKNQREKVVFPLGFWLKSLNFKVLGAISNQ